MIKITLKEKVSKLKEYGYIEITDKLIEDMKVADKKLYDGLLTIIREKGRPILIIFFHNTFVTYSYEFIENKSIEEIIKGTRKLLKDFDINF